MGLKPQDNKQSDTRKEWSPLELAEVKPAEVAGAGEERLPSLLVR
jgi:hypothetical protein